MYPHLPVAGQVALVTGGSSGIGEGIARHLAAAGARGVLTYGRHDEEAKESVREIEAAGGEALAVSADVSDEASVLALFDAAREAYGTVDIVVSNAGLQDDAAIGDMTVAQWDHVMGVNMRGMFLTTREAVKEFRRRGPVKGKRRLGRILCVSSVHEIIPWGGHVNYAASKGGAMLYMKSLAQEVSGEGIRVNGIAPGAIATPINHQAWETPEAERSLNTLIPIGRVGLPDDVGAAAVWLASDASDYVVGHSLLIDGGMALYYNFRDNG
ncbi:glucose 1-dehydrogenase [bacterium]|nr:MAG: glucose 1-dehydrogenase [bacterium]